MHDKQKPKWLAVGRYDGKFETRSQLTPSSQRNSTERGSVTKEEEEFGYKTVKYYANAQLQSSHQYSPEIKWEKGQFCQQNQGMDPFRDVSANKLRIKNISQQQLLQLQVEQSACMAFRDSHLPIYLRNNQHQIHYQLEPQSVNSSIIDDEIFHDQSVVIEEHQIAGYDVQSHPVDSEENCEHSQIIQVMSFASEQNSQVIHLSATQAYKFDHSPNSYIDKNQHRIPTRPQIPISPQRILTSQQNINKSPQNIPINSQNIPINPQTINKSPQNIPPSPHRINLNRQFISYNSKRQFTLDTKQNNLQNRGKMLFKITEKMNEMNELAHDLRTIQQTITKQMKLYQSSGNRPLFVGNQLMYMQLMQGLNQIIQKQVKSQVQITQRSLQLEIINIRRQLQQGRERMQKEKERQQREIVEKEMKWENQRVDFKKSLECKERQIQQLRHVISLKEEQLQHKDILLSNRQQQNNLNKQPTNHYHPITSSHPQQLTSPILPPDLEQLLNQKQLKIHQLSQQLQSLHQINTHLSYQKESLQEQLFTLEQKVIGVQMEVQQQVRYKIQQLQSSIHLKIHQNLQQTPSIATLNNNQQQCYLSTIDTLSTQINDLTEKCKSYQTYIRQQQQSYTINSQKITQHNKHYEQMLNKKLTEIQIREESLIEVEKDLLSMDRKLKEVEEKLSNEGALMDKKEKTLMEKDEQVERLLDEVKRKQEELYVWEKQLSQEDKMLTRKLNQFQRQKTTFQSQKHNKVNPLEVGYQQQIVSQRNGIQYQQYPVGEYQRVYGESPMQQQLVSHQNQQQYSQANVNAKQQQQYSNHHINSYHQNSHHQNSQVQAIFPQPLTLIPHNNQSSRQQVYPNYQQKSSNPQIYQPLTMGQNLSQKQNQPYQHNLQQIEHNYFNQNNKISQLSNQYNDYQHKKYAKSYEMRQNHRTENEKERESVRNRQQFMTLNINHLEQPPQRYQNYHPQPLSSKLYVSSTTDPRQNKQHLVEEILAKRRIAQQQRTQIKSLINGRPQMNGRPHLNQLLRKSQVCRDKSPSSHDNSQRYYHNSATSDAGTTNRRNKQKQHTRRLYQKSTKPSKDITGTINQRIHTTPSGSYSARRLTHNQKEQLSNGYVPKMFPKSNVPGVYDISEKLERLKAEIKREVRQLQ